MTPIEEPPADPGAKRQRIAKLMARAGLCSRRDAEAWIVDGRVSVNGIILTSPAIDVAAEDAILIDGEKIPAAEKTRLFLFHKPRGLVTSDHDPEGRATVADFLREHWPEGPRVVTIGRLDINTEGLLLLTNDGGLARLLELPQTGWVRRYRVRAKGMTDPGTLDALAAGVTIDGIDYAGIEAKLDRVQGANCWLTMGLREGKNREVKRVLEHIGLEVNRLIRLSFGPFQLLELAEGAVEEVRTRVLRDQLGETLAAQAGVDFGETESAKLTPREEKRAPREEKRAPREEKRAPREDKRAPREEKTPREARKRELRPTERGTRPSAPTRSARPPRDQPSSDRPSSDRAMRPRLDRRDARDEAPPPKRDRPIAGARKHVSTQRAAESDASRKGPRKRIERSDTHDRRDRAIKVERLVSARPAPDKAPSGRPRVSRSGPDARLPRGDAERRAGSRDRTERPLRRPAMDDRPRDEARPHRRDDRADTRRGDGPPTGRRHASPSALGKRERMSRSGAPPDRTESRRFDAAKKVRSTRPERGDAPAAPRRERAQSGRPGNDRPPAARDHRKTRSRPAGDRDETKRDDKAPRPGKGAASGRPMGAASRKPGAGRRPPPAGRNGPPRGKPSRGPSKPKR